MSRATRDAATVAAALLLLTAAPLRAGAAEPQQQPRLAVEPLPETAELESLTDALVRWAGRGVAGATLLHVDINARAEALSDRQAAALAAARAAPAAGRADAALRALRETGPFDHSFARAALALGIAREAVWVVPFDYFRHPDPGAHLRQDLQSAGFAAGELETFALVDGCFRGRVAGAPFAVCGAEGLPRITGPVLLNLHADFLFSAAAAARSNPLAETRKILAALAAGGYAAADAVVHASAGPLSGSVLNPELRWVGEAAAQALREPALLDRPEGVRRWSSLQKLAALSAFANDAELLHETLPALTIHDEDPALHLYAAKALAGLGRLDESEAHAVRACRIHPSYCQGLPWIGLRLVDAGDVDGAERFFATGARLRPGMTFGQASRGVELARAGRIDAALAVFRALAEAGAAFPAGFMAGAIALGRGDRAEARRLFDLAVQALRPGRPTVIDDPTAVQAVRDAIRFYREEGLADRAALLEGGSVLWMPSEDAPPEQEAPAATDTRP